MHDNAKLKLLTVGSVIPSTSPLIDVFQKARTYDSLSSF